MNLIYEVSSSVIKNTYKVFASLLFDNNFTYGEQIMKRDGEPVLANGAQQTINQFAECALANTFFRNGADRRFEPGAARIAITECGWNPFKNGNVDVLKISRLKKILEFITANYNDRNKIDNYLNNKSLSEIYAAYKDELSKNKDVENKKLSAEVFDNEHKYKIIRIDSFAQSKKYSDFTNPKSRWCVTYNSSNYRDYTEFGTYAMYFCLRDDINTVKYKIGENCPLDDYGKSMLCVIVDTEGDLVTFTTRWNHKDANNKPVPADKGVGDKMTVSRIVGVNFNEVFKPYTPEDLQKIKDARTDARIIKSYEELTANNKPSADFDEFISAVVDYFEDKNNDLLNDGADEDDLYPIDTYDDVFNLIDEYEEDTNDLANDYSFDISRCTAYGDKAIIASTNGYYKLVTFKAELTGWCDKILLFNRKSPIYFVKEHGADSYSIRGFKGTINADELKGKKIINARLEPGLYDNRNGRYLFIVQLDSGDEHLAEVYENVFHLSAKFDLPNDYVIKNDLYIESANRFNYPEQLYGVWKIQRKGSNEFNICSTGSEFRPILEDEFSSFVSGLSNAATDMILLKKGDDYIVCRLSKDLSEAEYITDSPVANKPLKLRDGTYIIVNNMTLAGKLNRREDTLYKYDLTVCTKYKIFKLNGIYATISMLEHWFEPTWVHPTGYIEAPKEVLDNNSGALGIYLKDLSNMEYVIIDTRGNTLYTDTVGRQYSPCTIKVEWDVSYETAAIVKVGYSYEKRVHLEDMFKNIKSESTMLNYAAFLC